MTRNIALILFLFSFGAVAQSLTIGNVAFHPVAGGEKPKETLHSFVEVFENNVTNQGRRIKLYVELVPAKDPQNKTAPMFIVMGGPGQAATDLVSFFSEIFSVINQHSDLVFIDQRGTGKSNPLQLRGTYQTLADYFKDDFMDDAVVKMSLLELSRQHDLRCYGTANAILDIDEVRQQMGYDKINLYGTSYGTRVAIAYINQYPQRVRTATLKGLVPPELVIPAQFANDAQRSLDLLFKDCHETEACRTVYPDLEKEWKTFMQRTWPMRVAVANPETKKIDSVQLTREIVALNMRVLLMSPSTTKNIPFLIREFNRGNHVPLTNLMLSIKKSYLKGVYDGMTLCVVCNEDYPVLSTIEPDVSSSTFLGSYWIDRVMNACSIWNSEKYRASKPTASPQSTPVLIISGNRDGATPPANGDEVLKYFPNGRHVVINAGSHSFDGMRNCVENIITEFVTTAQTKVLSTGCVETILFPPYKLD